MTDTQRSGDQATPDDGLGAKGVRPKRRRRRLRITMLSLAAVAVLLGAAAAGSFLFVNNKVGSIPRIPVNFLSQPHNGMTILITSSQIGPTGETPAQASGQTSNATGLIMLLHINADNKAGGVVSIPPQTMVNVPGRGEMQIQYAIAVGGPSLLVHTVIQVTDVPINHYARINFSQTAAVVDAVGGVSVTLRKATTSFGYVFHAGVNDINGNQSVAYARDPSLTETGRVLRQQSLVRAILDKMSDKHLLVNPLTLNRVLNGLVGVLTLDSNFSNSEVESLAAELGGLSGKAVSYVTAPTQVVHGTTVFKPAESKELWSAINSGTIAAFAKKYPATVTPPAP